MMVDIVPNWSDVEGTIIAVGAPVEDPPGFSPVILELSAAREVEGFCSMLTGDDKILDIRFPVELLRSLNLTAGRRIAVRVRRGGPPRVFFIHREFLRDLD